MQLHSDGKGHYEIHYDTEAPDEETVNVSGRMDTVKRLLAHFGSEGWELISVSTTRIRDDLVGDDFVDQNLWFKRPLESAG